MATKVITVSSQDDMTWYNGGSTPASRVIGYSDGKRRVGRLAFTAPSTGASNISISFTIMHGYYDKIPIRYYIGTSSTSHKNAGYDSTYTGTLSLIDKNLSGVASPVYDATAEVSMVLSPGATYYLWLFPGADTTGWYWGFVNGFTSTVTLSGAALTGISGSDGTLGSSHTLTLTRYSDDVSVHNVSVYYGSTLVKVLRSTSAAWSNKITWTPDISIAENEPSKSTIALTIKCYTYTGTSSNPKYVGSNSLVLQFTIPSALAKPDVDFTTVDVSSSNYLSEYGSFIQNLSTLGVSASASGLYGATISSYRITFCGTSKSGSTATFGITHTGNLGVTVTAYDSRGYSNSVTKSISVAAYSPPYAAITDIYRCTETGERNSNGEYVKVIFSGAITKFVGLSKDNGADFTLMRRLRGQGDMASVHALEELDGNFTPTNYSVIVKTSTSGSYEFCIRANDNFYRKESLYRTIQAGESLIQLKKNPSAVSFGTKEYIENTALFGMAAKLLKGLSLDVAQVASFDDVGNSLSERLTMLADGSVDFCCFIISGAFWNCLLFKSNDSYAIAEFFGYTGKKRMTMTDGVWSDVVIGDEDRFQPMTQREYDALISSGNDNPDVFYLIVEETE